MRFALAELLSSRCPNLWHDLHAAGKLINGELEVPDALASPLLASCAEAPPIVFAPLPVFTARLRTEAEKIPLRAICQTCDFNLAGECHGSSCCGGRVPVEVRLNLSSTTCPRSLWPGLPD